MRLRTRLRQLRSRRTRERLRLRTRLRQLRSRRRRERVPRKVDPYERWVELNRFTPRVETRLRERLAEMEGLPTISVVMPVYRPPVRHLRSAIESVRGQIYEGWQLCIADDASADPEVEGLLDAASADERIEVICRAENGGISAATNSAAALAKGEFLLFLDHDDELEPDALAELALAIAADPETDMAYSDTDKIDESGRRYHPAFEPDWSPELLLTYMYCGQPLVIRRSLFEELGGMRIGFEGSQDHDLALRAAERARGVHHVPNVLYHWRAVAGSTAVSGDEKPHSYEAGRRAVQDAVERRGITATAVQPGWARGGGNSLFTLAFPDEGPSVAIVIPTRDRVDLLRRCVDSLRSTAYRPYQVVIADDGSAEAETLAYLRSLEGPQVLDCSDPEGRGFNFARICNQAAAAIDVELVLFLNNDTEVLEPAWLSQMVGYLSFEGVGAIGAQLRYGDGRVQHAGIVQGLHDGLAGHDFKLLAPGDRGYLSHVDCARNCLAVSAACMLVPRAQFLERGGFDEERFGIAYNDPDYCYRLVEDGYRVVYAPRARLLHHEGSTRRFADDPRIVANFRERYEGLCDPFHSPSLSLANERREIAPRHITTSPKRPVRTVVYAHNLNREGASKYLQDAVIDLARAGVLDPVVVTPEDGPLRQEYEDRSVPVVVTDLPVTGPDIGRYGYAQARLVEQLREHRAEVVWANTLLGFPGIDAANAASVPSVWLIHESEGPHSYLLEFHSAEVAARGRACLQYPYRVVFASPRTRAVYEHLNTHENYCVVPNGIPEEWVRQANEISPGQARELLDLPPDELVLLSIGTVCERKRQADLIDALIGMSDQQREGVRALIVGGLWPGYAQELIWRVRSLGPDVADRIRISDVTAAPELFYRAADALVVTSELESYPRVTLEAMACGLPIISTPAFGLSEQIRDGINGIVFPSGDVEALREAILTLARDEPRRRALAEASPWVLRSLPSYEWMVRHYAAFVQEAYFTASDTPMTSEHPVPSPSVPAWR